jgi:hypothetical protein
MKILVEEVFIIFKVFVLYMMITKISFIQCL